VKAFAVELAEERAARAPVTDDPVEAIMQAVAEHEGLPWPDSDPRFGDPWARPAWNYEPDAERFAAHLIYRLTGLTQEQTAQRLGYASPSCKVPGPGPPDLRAYVDGCDDDGNDLGGYPLERIVARAEELLQAPLVEDGVAIRSGERRLNTRRWYGPDDWIER
jgi:hypothetical protein